MKKYLVLITILLILIIWVLINYLPKINKNSKEIINNKSNLISKIPVVKGKEISLYNPKDNTFKDLYEGNRIFGIIGNGKYLLCGIGEALYKEDSIGYLSGYNLFLINTETKEKNHLLGYEEPKLIDIQLGKGKIKTIKDGGDIVSLKIHPDEKRIFYVDKNCALWEFNIEKNEKKKLTSDWRVSARFFVISPKGDRIYYSVYPENYIEDMNPQDGISIEFLDLSSYEKKIFKKAERNPEVFCEGATYQVIGGDDEVLFIELGLDAIMTKILGKNYNRATWEGLLVSKSEQFEIIKEYPYPDRNEPPYLFGMCFDYIKKDDFSYLIGVYQKNIWEGAEIKESSQNLILAKFKGPELIEVKILKENLFLGFKARFTFDGNIAYEENPDEWVIIDLDGNLLLKLPKGTQPF